MTNPAALSFGDPSRKKAIVISHERSGTHFLMNTLALNFGYIENPWLNLDYERGLNFYSSNVLLAFFRQLHDRPLLNVAKSHHQADFFSPLIDYLTEQFHVFYIFRDPRDVMLSFWRLISRLEWDEGPVASSVGDFMRSAPRGGILRYQMEQAPTLLHRWKNHVEGWLELASTTDNHSIHLLSYEDLNLAFDDTVKNIAGQIGYPVTDPIAPPKGENAVLPGAGKTGLYREYFTGDDLEFVQEVAGPLMEQLGIPWVRE